MNPFTKMHIALHDAKHRRRQKKLLRNVPHVGRNVYVSLDALFSNPETVTIGSHVWIGEQFRGMGAGGIRIGDGTIISRCVEIWTSNHTYDASDLRSLPYDRRTSCKPVTIGENVWVGTHVLFVPGVTVGEGSVIGMGAVVTSDVPPLAVVGGNPARVLKYRDKDTYERLKAEGKIYLDMEYDYDVSSLRKSEY